MSLSSWVKSCAAALACAVVATGTALADPALWRLSDEDSDIYIFGTIHILPPDLVWRNETVDAAFASAGRVYFEVPTDPEAQGALQPAPRAARRGHGRDVGPGHGLPIGRRPTSLSGRPHLRLRFGVGGVRIPGRRVVDPPGGEEEDATDDAAHCGDEVAQPVTRQVT